MSHEVERGSHSIMALLILLILVLQPVYAHNGVWLMRMASHPYKTKLYTAEQLVGWSLERWCLDWLDAKGALVLCHAINDESDSIYNSTFLPDFGDIIEKEDVGYMENTFACEGTEESLSDCPVKPAVPRCPSGRTGFVDCSYEDNYKKNFSSSLVGSQTSGQGILKLQSQNFPTIVGKVCDDTGSWGENEAKVACRSLGYDVDNGVHAVSVCSGAEVLFPDSDAGLKYVIRDVKCDGTEWTLSECHHREMCKAWANEEDSPFTCADECQGQDVGVICLPGSNDHA